jgi:hypothetical protein
LHPLLLQPTGKLQAGELRALVGCTSMSRKESTTDFPVMGNKSGHSYRRMQAWPGTRFPLVLQSPKNGERRRRPGHAQSEAGTTGAH